MAGIVRGVKVGVVDLMREGGNKRGSVGVRRAGGSREESALAIWAFTLLPIGSPYIWDNDDDCVCLADELADDDWLDMILLPWQFSRDTTGMTGGRTTGGWIGCVFWCSCSWFSEDWGAGVDESQDAEVCLLLSPCHWRRMASGLSTIDMSSGFEALVFFGSLWYFFLLRPTGGLVISGGAEEDGVPSFWEDIGNGSLAV